MPIMDDDNQNITSGFIYFMLAMTADERHSAVDQSRCQYIYCTSPIDDHDDHNTTCHVTTEEFGKDHSFQSILSKSIHLYIYPIFIFIGILGNSLSSFIMFINVRRSSYPVSLYLTVLAFVDCLFLLGSALPDWISQIHSTFDIKHLSDISCRFVYWFGNFTTHLSVGLVVGVTVERFIAVQYPLTAHKLHTVTHTRITLILLILFFFFLDSPVLFLVKHLKEIVHSIHTCLNDTNVRYETLHLIRCVPTNKHYEQIWVCVDFIVYAFLPFLMIITLNSLIIRRLIDAQRFRQRMFRFHNTLRQDQPEVKYRHYSECHQEIEMSEKHLRYSRRLRSVPETKPLVTMLRPQSSQIEKRHRRYSTKQSSISTELSTLSSEIKTRSQHQFEISSIRHKSSSHTSHSNNARLTILLLFVSCSFLILTLPTVVLNLIMSIRSSILFPNHHFNSSSMENNTHSYTILFYTLTRLLMIINHSMNFILYFVFGKRFRRDFKQLFLNFWSKRK